MRSDLTRNDRRDRECGNGSPRCHLAPAPPDGNPLALCDGHLSEHRKRCGIPEPVECPACNPIAVYQDGRYLTIVGAMCFECGLTNGGTVASDENRRDARERMRLRLRALWRDGDWGAEWKAILARCPTSLWESVARASFRNRPSPEWIFIEKNLIEKQGVPYERP